EAHVCAFPHAVDAARSLVAGELQAEDAAVERVGGVEVVGREEGEEGVGLHAALTMAYGPTAFARVSMASRFRGGARNRVGLPISWYVDHDLSDAPRTTRPVAGDRWDSGGEAGVRRCRAMPNCNAN